MTLAVMSLGSNQGDRLDWLHKGVQQLIDQSVLRDVLTSSVYETEPVGGPEQNPYLNMVVMGDTKLEPQQLLDAIAQIEHQCGRVRFERWGPRTLDIDIVSFNHVEMDEPNLQIPHPRAHERAFVLVPWAEIDPQGFLGQNGTVEDCLVNVSQETVRFHSAFVLES